MYLNVQLLLSIDENMKFKMYSNRKILKTDMYVLKARKKKSERQSF